MVGNLEGDLINLKLKYYNKSLLIVNFSGNMQLCTPLLARGPSHTLLLTAALVLLDGVE